MTTPEPAPQPAPLTDRQYYGKWLESIDKRLEKLNNKFAFLLWIIVLYIGLSFFNLLLSF